MVGKAVDNECTEAVMTQYQILQTLLLFVCCCCCCFLGEGGGGQIFIYNNDLVVEMFSMKHFEMISITLEVNHNLRGYIYQGLKLRFKVQAATRMNQFGSHRT